MRHGPPLTEPELDALEALVDGWLSQSAQENPAIASIERGEPGERLWIVRLLGEQKDISAVWLRLGQRTLVYETFLMPAPETNHAALYEQLLRRNRHLDGVQLAIGEEDAIFLVGHLRADHLDADTLDWVLGTVYEAIERCFRPAIRLGFANRFADR